MKSFKTRKIQRIGKSLWISLPKKWAERTGIKQGDQLIAESNPEGLLLKSTGGRK